MTVGSGRASRHFPLSPFTTRWPVELGHGGASRRSSCPDRQVRHGPSATDCRLRISGCRQSDAHGYQQGLDVQQTYPRCSSQQPGSIHCVVMVGVARHRRSRTSQDRHREPGPDRVYRSVKSVASAMGCATPGGGRRNVTKSRILRTLSSGVSRAVRHSISGLSGGS
jgi:hypothetical protein